MIEYDDATDVAPEVVRRHLGGYLACLEIGIPWLITERDVITHIIRVHERNFTN